METEGTPPVEAEWTASFAEGRDDPGIEVDLPRVLEPWLFFSLLTLAQRASTALRANFRLFRRGCERAGDTVNRRCAERSYSKPHRATLRPLNHKRLASR